MIFYLDNAATTYMYPEVIEAMNYYMNNFYNPSSAYSVGKKVKEKITECREKIAELINAKPEEIYFTSGGTESNNWACNEAKRRKGHIITSTIEHKAILMPLKNYDNVSYINPDKSGIINIYSIRENIRRDTSFISIMMANNEIGTIEPVDEIGMLARNYNILFHTDAVQAFGHIEIDVKKSGIDMLSASAHKFHGPKGCGFLYATKDMELMPFIYGGGQENGLRSGTENVPGIIAMTKAAEISYKNMQKENAHLKMINRYISERLLKEIDGCVYNGSREKRLPNNINVSFRGIDGRALLALLETEGIYASGASACNAKENKSYVLAAIGLNDMFLSGSLRLTLDTRITMAQAEYIVNVIKKCVSYIRNK